MDPTNRSIGGNESVERDLRYIYPLYAFSWGNMNKCLFTPGRETQHRSSQKPLLRAKSEEPYLAINSRGALDCEGIEVPRRVMQLTLQNAQILAEDQEGK
ncbi:hypothetical protein STEG23_025608 [Scotinomys teguina]